MRRFLALCACAALLLCPLAAGAEAAQAVESEPAGAIQPIEGAVCYPEGATESDAAFVFRYAYPQLAGDDPADLAINQQFAAQIDSLRETTIPEIVDSLDAPPAAGEPARFAELGYTVTARTDAYISVLWSLRQFLGGDEAESVIGAVFARQGVYAGQPLTLSQATGLEQADDGTGRSYAARLASGLIWQIVTEPGELREYDFFEDLSQEAFEAAFDPETDFCIDADGNIVFYLQSGVVASEVEGVLYFPFSVAELLTAGKE